MKRMSFALAVGPRAEAGLGQDRGGPASRLIWERRRALTQSETSSLPGYISVRGELLLVGPSGLLENSVRLRLELRPKASRIIQLRMNW